MSSVLNIGDHQTTVSINGVGNPGAVSLGIGVVGIGREYFRHAPPTPGELEAAIDVVENALMPEIPRLRGRGSLLTSDAESVALLAFSGLPANTASELDRDAIERLFNRLVEVANGRPASSEGMPTRAGFAANLLILRELMHHADFRSITIVPPGN